MYFRKLTAPVLTITIKIFVSASLCILPVHLAGPVQARNQDQETFANTPCDGICMQYMSLFAAAVSEIAYNTPFRACTKQPIFYHDEQNAVQS